MQSPSAQESIVKQMDAIGSVMQYLNTLLYKADMASKSIVADEESKDELLNDSGDM